MKFGKGSFLQFVSALLKGDKDAAIPKKVEFRRRQEKIARRIERSLREKRRKHEAISLPNGHNFGTFRPLLMPRGRMDVSGSSDVCIARLKGEMPTRKLWRKMQLIAKRRAA